MRPSSPELYGAAGFAVDEAAYEAEVATPLTPETYYRQGSQAGKIDYTKYRTKMCRNALMGIECPFRDRCVFAHSDVELRTAPETPPTYENLCSSAA